MTEAPSAPPGAGRRPSLGRTTAAIAAGLVLVLGGCSSDDGGDAQESTTTLSVPVLVGGGGDPAVAGTWSAPAGDLLESIFEGQGLEAEVACDAELVLELGPEGAFDQTITGTCELPEGPGAVEVEQSGRYRADDGTMAVAEVEGTGVIRGDDGEELELGDVEALGAGIADLPYVVEGDRLVLGDPEAGGLALTRS